MTLLGCPTEITASTLTIHKIATLPHIIFFPVGSNYVRRVDLLWAPQEMVETDLTETAEILWLSSYCKKITRGIICKYNSW